MDALEEANALIVALTDTLLEKRERVTALEARVGPLEVACRAASAFCEVVDNYNASQGNATPEDVLELEEWAQKICEEFQCSYRIWVSG